VAGVSKLPGSDAQGYLLTNVRSPNYVVAFDGSPSRKFEPANSEETILVNDSTTNEPEQEPVLDFRKFDALPAKTPEKYSSSPIELLDSITPLEENVSRNEQSTPQTLRSGSTLQQGPVQLLLPE
jgi:hypothetical protein